MSSEISAAICISGEDLNFEECTAAIGITPTQKFVRKFDYGSSVIPAREWSFECAKEQLWSVDDAVVLLLDRLSGLEDKIVNFAVKHGYEISVCCNVTIHEDRPVYDLSASTLQKMVQLKADFAMDIFDYS